MDSNSREAAIELLRGAATGGPRVEVLPEGGRPTNVAEALAMQDEVVARLERPIGGWKVATDPAGTVMYGAIYAMDTLPSPATITSARYPMLGIEGEIAFRFSKDLPLRARPYSRAELEAVLTPFAGIEIVDTRFVSYADTPSIVRLADRMSNGGMVVTPSDRRPADLTAVPVTLTIGGKVIVSAIGGHARNDPFLPAVEFVNAVQGKQGFTAGQFITTGTCTGLSYAQPGQLVVVEFEGLGRVELTVAS